MVGEEAELVREICRRYADVGSAPQVSAWLNERGLTRKRWRSRRRPSAGGGGYRAATVRTILKNPLYLGEVMHKGERYQGQHRAIVEEALFARVQDRLEKNARGQHKRRPNART